MPSSIMQLEASTRVDRAWGAGARTRLDCHLLGIPPAKVYSAIAPFAQKRPQADLLKHLHEGITLVTWMDEAMLDMHSLI